MAANTGKRKRLRESTAAYVASQPLFDALRTGTSRVHEQFASLTIARDLVQQLHVKLPNQDSESDINNHERYMDSAVKAWRSATEIYAGIFEALAEVTGAEPSQGKQERPEHAQFVEMARAASEAKRSAHSFVLHEETVKTSAAVRASEQADPGRKEDEAGADEDAKRKDSKKFAGSKMFSMPPGTTPTSPTLREIHAKRAAQERIGLGDQRPRKAPRTGDVSFSAQEPLCRQAPSQQTVPKVQYEDVSAQVEERIKAKQAAKNAAKKQKKRKRGSGDSFASVQSKPDGQSQKPKKKKAKGSNGGLTVPVQNGGAQKHEREDGVEGGPRKEKKLKTSTSNKA